MRKTIWFTVIALILLVSILAGCLTTQSGAGGSDKLEILSHESTLNEYGYIVVEGTAKTHTENRIWTTQHRLSIPTRFARS